MQQRLARGADSFLSLSARVDLLIGEGLAETADVSVSICVCVCTDLSLSILSLSPYVY